MHNVLCEAIHLELIQRINQRNHRVQAQLKCSVTIFIYYFNIHFLIIEFSSLTNCTIIPH